jgi:predicted amidohydrolase
MTRVASVQLEIAVEETKADRVRRVGADVESLAGADLILLPEVWNVGYFDFEGYEAGAEPLDGPTITRLSDAARTAGAWVLAGSIVERNGDELFNTSVLLDRSGEIAATYRKIHLFGYGSRERALLARGQAVAVADTELGRIGLATCYDLRFPELFRAMADQGAELFGVVSAWPYPRVEAWTVLNRARALENQAWLISSNCAGDTPPCCGRSMVVDPWGTTVAAAGDRPATLVADIDISMARTARDDFPALRDRVFETGGIA